ncbi:D-alanyl-D-alanine carboxypeptidase (penicillin-binding protein 5/6) [Desulfonatronum thiosulfatophilum]|uniref:serine-type D-Ala-D-Ala carboxypeptidase n=1 Tax=Desulfonatronum thiosulfatophilum TaxID=617002 RepID=A0A1G6D874_9BACT|nr:D-alanyl-D-alanine carboxypeptidase family protein [Desulfonatronum thiosulfatophilum]SDB41384.1 D-alanyl-D-alanine carboxypeptidase (penicillin-binding protein 5/6) [Desulfonatronum thiosulfatophilum]
MRLQRTLIFFLLFLLFAASAQARLLVDPPSGLTARNFFLMDADSGATLAGKDADERVEPASLTKIMTAYLVFRQLQNGNLAMDELVHVSEQAWRTGMTGASRMYIDVGSLVTVEDLIRGMIVQSGNDACVALAERIAGTEAAFVDLMNAQALELGLTNTQFQNSHGLPSTQEQYTTARDIVTLARKLIINFPEYYSFYSEREFTFNNIRQYNRNLLLGRDPSVDGVKTGWTSAAGYNLVTSAKRDDMRLVAVVMGIDAPNTRQGGLARADQSQALLNWGFRQFETVLVRSSGQTIVDPRIWFGSETRLPVGVATDFFASIPRGSQDNLRLEMVVSEHIQAPVNIGDTVGELQLFLGDEPVATHPLVAMRTIDEGNIFRHLTDRVLRMFH